MPHSSGPKPKKGKDDRLYCFDVQVYGEIETIKNENEINEALTIPNDRFIDCKSLICCSGCKCSIWDCVSYIEEFLKQKKGKNVSQEDVRFKYVERYNLIRNYQAVLGKNNNDFTTLPICVPQCMIDGSYSVALGLTDEGSV